MTVAVGPSQRGSGAARSLLSPFTPLRRSQTMAAQSCAALCDGEKTAYAATWVLAGACEPVGEPILTPTYLRRPYLRRDPPLLMIEDAPHGSERPVTERALALARAFMVLNGALRADLDEARAEVRQLKAKNEELETKLAEEARRAARARVKEAVMTGDDMPAPPAKRQRAQSSGLSPEHAPELPEP